MAKLEIFYLENCPYCRGARQAVEALKKENPAYDAIEIEWIEESRNPDRVAGHDYYYVPSIYDRNRKLYETNPADDYNVILNHVRESFDAVLAG